jgi:hypothetical protein
LGRITLDVCFGNRQNYRKEKLDFEVMDWPSQYHVILGRPAFSRFMAVPYYTYLVLKIPRPRGIITVKGSFELSNICDKEFHKMVQTFRMIAKYGQVKGKTDKETTSSMKQPKENKGRNIEPEAKKPRVQEENPGKSTTNESGSPAT